MNCRIILYKVVFLIVFDFKLGYHCRFWLST